VEKDAAIGAGAVILLGIVIGENSLVEAGSVVTKDVQLGHLVVGNLARVIKKVEEIKYPLGFYKLGKVYSWRKK
jgi:acetyltransferase-like isoleucine patch superfamily enzyme